MIRDKMKELHSGFYSKNFPTFKKMGFGKTASLLLVLFLTVGTIFTFKQLQTQQQVKSSAATTPFVAPTPFPNCIFSNTTPAGQANPSVEYEPMGAVWCFPLSAPGTATRIKSTNSWVDEFDTNVQMQDLSAGAAASTMDYSVFDGTKQLGSIYNSKHWLNANHWMVDVSGVDTDGAPPYDIGATMMRPNATFTTENGQITIEADVASAVPELAVQAWPEFVITTADHPGKPYPVGKTPPAGFNDDFRREATYVYQAFPGSWTLGCRLQVDGGFTCALEDDTWGSDTNSRIFELSHFQCGNVESGNHPGSIYGCNSIWGGFPANVPAAVKPYKRACQPNQMDMFCRDRFRWEITKNRLTWYVNGVKYMEHTDFEPAAQTAMETMLSKPVYVYFGEFNYKVGKPFRTHWDRIAVNPHDVPGHLQPPTKSPSFCLGEPQNTCPMIMANPGQPVVSSNKVDILDFVYNSPNITITAGTTVTWTNKTTSNITHSVTSDQAGLFDSGMMAANQTFSYTFNTPGTYNYHCIPHPGMTGKVTVLPADGSPMPTMPMATTAPTPTGTSQVVATYNTMLMGNQEVPPNNSTGMGNAKLTLFADNSAKLDLSFSGLSSAQTAAHIHGPAPVGVSAGILIGLPVGQLSGYAFTLTPTQVTYLQSGQLYVNVHTNNFTAGEIRGQFGSGTITPTAVIPTPTRIPTAIPTPTRVPTPIPTGSGKVGDLNNDNQINITDLSILLSNWNTNNPTADLNHDGIVSIIDMSTLLSNWNK